MTHFKSKCIKTENLGIKSPPSLLGVSFTKGDLRATKTKQALTEAEGRTRDSIPHLGSQTYMCGGRRVCSDRRSKSFPSMYTLYTD